MQIKPASTPTILEVAMAKMMTKKDIITAGLIAKELEGEIGAEAIVTAGVMDANERDIILDDYDLKEVLSKVFTNDKFEKKAQFIGNLLRNIGKGGRGALDVMKNIGKGVGQGAVDLAKGVGQGAANLAKGIGNIPGALEQKGYELQQQHYQQQTQNLQSASKAMITQYQQLQGTLGNLGRTTIGLQNAIQKGQLDPNLVNTAQGLVKSLMNQLNTINQHIATISKMKAMPQAPSPVRGQQPAIPMSQQLAKPAANPKTLQF